MRRAAAFMSVILFSGVGLVGGNSPPPAAAPSPDSALAQLADGNARFAAGQSEGPRRDQDRRCATFVDGQKPVAAVLACADSRMPVELLLDAGIGDVFTVRVAGNVAATNELASIEYAVEHLGIPLVVVMGHTRCGAVTAAVQGGKHEGNLGELLREIEPAAQQAAAENTQASAPRVLSAAIRLNVLHSMEQVIRQSHATRAGISAGKLKVVGAVYDLHSGQVQWLGEHPEQTHWLDGKVEHASKPARPTTARKPTPAHAPEPTHAPEAAHPAAHPAPAARPGVIRLDDHHAPKAKQPAKPAASKHDEHGSHEGDAGKEANAAAPATQAAAQQHNYLALGGCMAGGVMLSTLVAHFIRPRKNKD